MSAARRPTAAPARFPYTEHRTMAQVADDEANGVQLNCPGCDKVYLVARERLEAAHGWHCVTCHHRWPNAQRARPPSEQAA